jgi:hypothetical protein
MERGLSAPVFFTQRWRDGVLVGKLKKDAALPAVFSFCNPFEISQLLNPVGLVSHHGFNVKSGARLEPWRRN